MISQRYNVSGLVGSAGLMHIVVVSGVFSSSSGRITILQHLGQPNLLYGLALNFLLMQNCHGNALFPVATMARKSCFILISDDHLKNPSPQKFGRFFLDKDSEL